MTALLNRLAAIGILLALPLLAWLLVIEPMIGEVVDRQEEIVRQTERLDRLKAMIARIPQLKRQGDEMKTRLDAEGGIWTGDSDAVVSAQMEDLLRRTATSWHGTVKSSSQLRSAEAQEFLIVKVRFSMDGTLEAVEKTLAAIEAARPAIFVDSFTIAAPANATAADKPPVLSLDLEVMGYTRKAEK